MRLLLDTHVFLWWLDGRRSLGRRTRAAIESSESEVLVSSASVWEIAIKLSVGRLRWKADAAVTLDGSIAACGFAELPVTARHAAAVRDLPLHHGDPFDRLLIAQANAERLRIVSAEEAFRSYGIALMEPDA